MHTLGRNETFYCARVDRLCSRTLSNRVDFERLDVRLYVFTSKLKYILDFYFYTGTQDISRNDKYPASNLVSYHQILHHSHL